MNNHMMAAVLYGKEHLQVEPVAVPTIESGDILVRVKVALTCGTDVKVFRRGYHALLEVARNGKLPADRMRSSLKRIAAMKSIVKPPVPFDSDRVKALSEETAKLNEKLNYKYGGTI